MKRCQVIIPVFGEFAVAIEVVKRVCEFTPPDVVINVIDDGSPNVDEFEKLLIKNHLMNRLNFVKQKENLGFVQTINGGFKASHPDDVIILNSDCFVSAGWYENLINTSRTSDLVSTVTAMTNEGSIASVKLGNERLTMFGPVGIDQLNEKMKDIDIDINFLVQAPTGVGHCMWVSRISLETVGYFDEIFSPGYGEEVDFCFRATRKGFHHLICRKTLVYHVSGGTFGDRKSELQIINDKILRFRYPFYHEVIKGMHDRNSELEAAFLNVLLTTRPLRLLLDLRLASNDSTGTSRFSIELAKAVLANNKCETLLLVEKWSVSKFVAIFGHNKIISADSVLDFVDSHNKFDVVFRVGQIHSTIALEELWNFAFRVGIIQLDFISADNFSYFENSNIYLEFVDASKFALLMCDSVLYLSRTIINESLRYCPNQINTESGYTDCGFDHISNIVRKVQNCFSVVILGTAYAHKNREWVIKILANIINSDIPDLKIYLIGGTPSNGETTSSDQRLVNSLGITKNVEFINQISDVDLDSILQTCSLSISSSISEGFGMVPLEMAMKGVIPVSYKGTSFVEHAGRLPYSLGLVDADEDGQTIRRLLTDNSSRTEQMQFATDIATKYRWEDSAQKLIDSAYKAARRPSQIYPEMRRKLFDTKVKNKMKLSPMILNLRNSKFLIWVFPPGSRRTARISKLVLNFFKI